MEPLRTVACLIYPDVMSLDVTGPMQVFASANAERERQGLPPAYRLLLLADDAAPLATSSGIRLCPDEPWATVTLASIDTLLVPGGIGVDEQCRHMAVLDWLKQAHQQVRRLGSVCSGALILAAAGLLDGHRATTHWADVDCLRQRHPAIDVQAERLHTYDPHDAHDSRLFTSAGVTAGIDLALALVEADLGRILALAVAQRLVMFLRRPGDQAQFSPLLAPNNHSRDRLAALLDWIPANLAADLSIETLAARAHLTPRTLSRLFVQELGIGPGRYVERVRLEAARSLLLGAQASVTTVARLTGFGHPENMRRSFRKHLSVSPQELAARFA